MSAVATLDTIKNTLLEIDGAVHRYTRGGYVRGLSPGSAPTPDLLYEAANAQGMPAMGDSLSSSYGGLKLARMRVIPDDDDSATVQLFYESLTGMIASVYTITDSSATDEIETQFYPGTRTQIRLEAYTYTPPAGPTPQQSPGPGATGPKSITVPACPATIRCFRTVRQIQIYQLAIGKPVGNDSDNVRSVNNGVWCGKKKGYWRLSQYQTKISRYQGYYTRSCTANTLVDQDWSVITGMTNHFSGTKAYIADADITANLKADYAYGPIYTPGSNKFDKGFARVGPYPTANLTKIFGFSQI